MLQFEDSDDDDCEGFFLRPMNEYNITEKIKLANKELFETTQSEPRKSNSNPSQRVKFSHVLVDYEPEYSDSVLYLNDWDETFDNDIYNLNNLDDYFCQMDEINENIVMSDSNQTENNTVNVTVTEKIQNIVDVCEEIDNLNIDEEINPINDDNESGDSYVEISNVETIQFAHTNEDKKILIDIPLNSKVDVHSEDNVICDPHDDNLQQDQKPKSPVLKRKEIPNKTENTNDSKLKGFRKCCSFKKLETNSLPKYMGYYSQYGLSRTQLETRHKYFMKMREKQIEKEQQNQHSELQKSIESETAFEIWLKNKSKNPKNRHKNMFDVNRKKH